MSWEKVGVDQSKKIHDAQDTVVVVCPLEGEDIKDHYSVYIPSGVPNAMQKEFGDEYKKRGRTWQFNPRMFSIGVFYALRDHIDEIDQVFMEREYTGHTGFVVDIIRNWLRDETPGDTYPIEARAFQIHSRDHNERANDIANKVREGELDPKMVLEDYHFRKRMRI